MRTDHRAIHQVHFPVDCALAVGIALQRGPEPVPDAVLLPAVKAAGHCRPFPVAFRQVAPRGAGAQDPQDPIDDLAVLLIRSPRLRLLRWEQRFEPVPLLIG